MACLWKRNDEHSRRDGKLLVVSPSTMGLSSALMSERKERAAAGGAWIGTKSAIAARSCAERRAARQQTTALRARGFALLASSRLTSFRRLRACPACLQSQLIVAQHSVGAAPNELAGIATGVAAPDIRGCGTGECEMPPADPPSSRTRRNTSTPP